MGKTSSPAAARCATFDTFLAAMAQVPYPGVLLYHDAALVRANGTPLDLGRLPPNVRAIEDDGSTGSWLDHMRRARLVVMTTLPDSIRAIGISSYLSTMALRVRHHHRRPGYSRHPDRRGARRPRRPTPPPWPTPSAAPGPTTPSARAPPPPAAPTPSRSPGRREYADVIRVCERVVADQAGKRVTLSPLSCIDGDCFRLPLGGRKMDLTGGEISAITRAAGQR